MFSNLFPSDEEKKERLSKLITLIENLFNKFTDNKLIIGYTIFAIHCLSIALLFGFVIFNNITIINFVIIFSILVGSLIVNLYYGGKGCTLVKLERYFFDCKEWYGPTTIFYKIFNIPANIENKHISEKISFVSWSGFTIFLFYKLYQIYKTKFSNTVLSRKTDKKENN